MLFGDQVDRRFMWLRGNVPELDGRRTDVYAASMIQAEALLKAGSYTALEAKPILFYYAILQAGNALMAQYNSRAWQPRGHGLTYSPPDTTGLVGDVVVRLDSESTRGAFQYICEAVGCAVPAPDSSATIAELWAALPGGSDQLRASTPALPLIATDVGFLLDMYDHPGTRLIGVPDDIARRYNSRARFQRDYPAAVGEAEYHYGTSEDGSIKFSELLDSTKPRDWRSAKEVIVRCTEESLRLRPDQTMGFNASPFLVLRAGSFGELPILLNWWLLYYGLSMCARYLSDIWGRAMRVDGSPDYLLLRDFLSATTIAEVVLVALEKGRTS